MRQHLFYRTNDHVDDLTDTGEESKRNGIRNDITHFTLFHRVLHHECPWCFTITHTYIECNIEYKRTHMEYIHNEIQHANKHSYWQPFQRGHNLLHKCKCKCRGL